MAQIIKKIGVSVKINTDSLENISHKCNILPESSECVDSLSISLNTDTKLAYQNHCQPKLKNSYQAVKEFI